MMKKVEFSDIFELIPIYRKNFYEDSESYQCPGNLKYVISAYKQPEEELSFNMFVSQDVGRYVVIGEDELACYVYLCCFEQNCLTVCFQSVYDNEIPRVHEAQYFDNFPPYIPTSKDLLPDIIIHHGGKNIILFTHKIIGCLKVKQDSPIKFDSKENFEKFVYKLEYDDWGDYVITNINIPVKNDGFTFDSSRCDGEFTFNLSNYVDDEFTFNPSQETFPMLR